MCATFVAFGVIFWIAILVLAAWGLMRIFPNLRQRASDALADLRQREDPAEEVLRSRFARGDISTEEYEGRLEILRGENGTARDSI